jgi:SAM-dependent methyltransferase
MQKAYAAQEVLYQKMKAKGIRCWEQLNNAETYKRNGQIERNALRFLVDALAQEWAPAKGRAIELGCGTGPMLRWLGKQGFGGLGVDVSRTAIAMAREQSKGLGLRFRRADLCGEPVAKAGSFDLALDGHCLHCITGPADRTRFLRNVHKMLREDGVFIVLTMCRPVDRKAFAEKYPTSPFVGSTVYAPFAEAADYLGGRIIKGKLHMPTRHIGHWKSILAELRDANFRPKLIRLNEHTEAEMVSSLCVAALK